MTTQRSTGALARGSRSVDAMALLFTVAFAAFGCNGTQPSIAPDRSPPLGGGGMSAVPGMNPPGTTPMGNNPGSSGGSGNAQVKVCNGVQSDKGAVDVVIKIGSQSFTVPSGSCKPVKGEACLSLPPGSAKITFGMGIKEVKEVFAQDVTIEAGQQYLVVATVDRATQKIGLGGGKLPVGAQCAAADPFAGASGGIAAGKFCHGLGEDDGNGGRLPVNFELAIGNVRLAASSANCSTPDDQMCLGLPTGPTTATLYRDGMALATGAITIEAGREYLFGLALNGNTPVIVSQILTGAPVCAAAGLEEAGKGMQLPAPGSTTPPPGTTPPGGTPTPGAPTTVKFCNRLDTGVAELMVGNATFVAKPGECVPAKGMACRQLPSGATTVVLILDGEEVVNSPATLPAGKEYIFRVGPDATGQDGITAGPIPAGMMCATFEPQ